MLGTRKDIARMQSNFYRDQFRKILHWLVMSVLVMLLLILVIIYQVLVLPSRDFYANTTDGKILFMPPRM
jgi:intracellular multiplication protein IcmL